MPWVFAEGNPFSTPTGNYDSIYSIQENGICFISVFLNFERCIDFLVRMIDRYGDEVLRELEEENTQDDFDRF